jgi:hypothetical protein
MRTCSWHWLAFFALQAPLLLLESRARRAARALGVSLHPFAARLLVLLALGAAADALFWPVVVQPLLLARLAAGARVVARDAAVVLAAAGDAAAGRGLWPGAPAAPQR